LRFELARYRVKYTVDELNGFRSGEATGDFQRFIDDDRAWGLGKTEEFGDSGAQDVAINGSHTFQAPVFGVTFQKSSDFIVTVHGDPEDVIGEVADTILKIAALGPESLLNVLDGLFPHVGLKQHLQREFA
jgi:hypothetical protein